MKTVLRRFHILLFRIHRWAYIRPRWVLVFATGLLVLFTSQIPQLKVIYNIDHLLTPDFETYSGLQSLEEKFHHQNVLFLTLIPKAGFWTETDLCQVQQHFQAVDHQTRPFLRLDSPLELRQAMSTADTLLYPRLLVLNCTTPSKKKVDLDVFKDSPWSGTLVHLKDQAVSFEMTLTDSDTAATEQIQKVIELGLPTTAKVLWTGSAAFQLAMKKGYEKTDAINGLLILLMFVLFRFFYGTWKSTLIFVGSLLYTAVILYGVMGYWGWPVDLLTNVLFMITLIATLEDFVLLSSVQAHHGRSGGKKSWRSHFRRILLPSFYTSVTTLFGFSGLLTSETEMIQRFGVLTALGALIEWFVLFVFFPALAQLLPWLRTWTDPQKAFRFRFLERMAAWTPSRPAGVLILLFGITGLFVGPSLKFEDSPFQIFPTTHPLRQTEAYLNERGWSVDAHLLFHDSDRVFQARVLETLKADPLVAEIDSPEQVLKFFEGTESSERRDLISSEVRSAPALQRYFGDPESSIEATRAILFLKSDEIHGLNHLREKTKVLCGDGCELAGSLVSYAEFGASIPKFLVESLFVSLVLVAMVLILLCWERKVPILPVLVSSFLGPALLLFLLWISDVQIYFVTTIFASILVGLTGDNAIHFIYASKKSLAHGIDERASASIQISFSLLIIPLLLLLSPFVPLQKLGLLFAAGTATSFLADVSFLKSVLQWGRRSDSKPRPVHLGE